MVDRQREDRDDNFSITVDDRTEGLTASEIVEVRIGSVTVRGPRPDPAEVTRNVAKAQEALRRLVEHGLDPGVDIPRMPGVPLYWADDGDSDLLVRELDGVIEKGHMVGGRFTVVPA